MTTLGIVLIAAYCLMTWIFGVGYVCHGVNRGYGLEGGRVVVAVLSPIVILPTMLLACFLIIGETYSEWRMGR